MDPNINVACRVGDQPLVRLALHPPLEGRLQLGATIAGTLDFRFSQEAAQQSSAAPKCVQVSLRRFELTLSWQTSNASNTNRPYCDAQHKLAWQHRP